MPATLDAWLRHLETLHPQKIDLELRRVRTVAERLDLLPASNKTITVAGTNGKGSCVAALAALLAKRGFTVGCYTSPHLLVFNERIVLNGIPAADADIMEAFSTIERERQDISLSYFEFATLAALYLFKSARVDFQVLEVGLGGRLDAVNMVDADACVITSIGIDHTEWLGDTRELIAIEKAGVARAGRPTVVAEENSPPTLMPALKELAAIPYGLGKHWQLVGQQLTLTDGTRFNLPDVDSLQTSNLAAAVVVLSKLGVSISQDDISASLGTLQVPGRRQVLDYRGRNWWLDVAHNSEAVQQLARVLARSPSPGKTHAIFGAMADKPLHDMISLVGEEISTWHLPRHPEIDRAASPEDLQALIGAVSVGAEVHCHASPQSAFEAVVVQSEVGDRILVFGSFVTVGAQLACLTRAQAGRETLD